MSFNTLPEHFTLDYAQNWFQRIQQFPSRLSDTVTTDQIDGERRRYSQFDAQEMTEITVRHGVTVRQDANSFIRWLVPKKHEITNILDEWDDKELGRQLSPKGAIILSQGLSYNRRKDDTIITAAEGNATTGEDADILVPLPASQRISVSFNPTGAAVDSGLTFGKVARARRIFMDNDLDLDGNAFAIISPEADEALVRDVDEARNKDFSNITPITDGTVNGKMWMGFMWKVHTRLTTGDVTGTAGTVQGTNNLFWHKSQMYFGDGEKRSSVDILPGESHGVQCRTRARMAGMRFEEKGVVLLETLAT